MLDFLIDLGIFNLKCFFVVWWASVYYDANAMRYERFSKSYKEFRDSFFSKN